MKISRSIVSAGVAACAALLLAGGLAQAQRGRPLNPSKITIGRDDGMRCVRSMLDDFARSRYLRRRLVQVQCPGVLTIPPINDPDDDPATVPINLRLVPSEALCLLRILDGDPRTPTAVALARCNIPLEQGR